MVSSIFAWGVGNGVHKGFHLVDYPNQLQATHKYEFFKLSNNNPWGGGRRGAMPTFSPCPHFMSE